MIGIKHRVPEEECIRKSKNGDQLKMHYRYPSVVMRGLIIVVLFGRMVKFLILHMIGLFHSKWVIDVQWSSI